MLRLVMPFFVAVSMALTAEAGPVPCEPELEPSLLYMVSGALTFLKSAEPHATSSTQRALIANAYFSLQAVPLLCHSDIRYQGLAYRQGGIKVSFQKELVQANGRAGKSEDYKRYWNLVAVIHEAIHLADFHQDINAESNECFTEKRTYGIILMGLKGNPDLLLRFQNLNGPGRAWSAGGSNYWYECENMDEIKSEFKKLGLH